MSSLSMNRRKFLGASSALTAAFGSGMWSMSVGAQGEQILNVRLIREIQILDPGYMIGGAETTTQAAILPRLAQIPSGDQWSWVPSAFVESIGHRDPTHIDFALKPGLMWSDGFGEFTTADVKFSYERMKESEWSGKWEALDHVEIHDAHRGTLVMSRPFAPDLADRARALDQRHRVQGGLRGEGYHPVHHRRPRPARPLPHP